MTTHPDRRRESGRDGATESAPSLHASDSDFESARRPPFLVVGVGASAGGLEAFTELLGALPVDTGMAFVLVQHLVPTHASALAEILGRATSMPIAEVVGEPEIEPNHVYVIPPDRSMVIADNHLRLFPRAARGTHHPIDQFFRSLAEHHREMAVGVVLSGMATDGTLGLEEIKAEGGITFAQDDSAKHDGMPRSAVASGCVDFVLPPAEIAREIARIAAHPFVSGAADARRAEVHGTLADSRKAELASILHILGDVTEVDFTQYKVNTLSRRIRRRMVLRKMEGFDEYVRYLRENPAEVQSLYQDILINVTSFFRDAEVFEVLRTMVAPTLLKGRSRDDPLRVWVVGCSTGEEAYSIAITLSEAMASSDEHIPVQVFATDVNAVGIERARAGVYSNERVQGVSRDQLRRFFVDLGGSYRVTKTIRDMCVFARHNVLDDPPFSRMDLVSCRNVLIYLEPVLQERIIPILRYALKPAGFLVLGASETVGSCRDSFQARDAKHRIFAKNPGSGPTSLGRSPFDTESGGQAEAQKSNRSRERGPRTMRPTVRGTDVHKVADRLLLAKFAPPAVLVDANLEVLQFRGNTEPYLVPARGKASFALMKMVRQGLLVPLQGLLREAQKQKAPVREKGVRIRVNGEDREVDLEVVPLKANTEPEAAYLILFEDAAATRAASAKDPRPALGNAEFERESSEADLAQVTRELASTREYLQSVIEQHEVTNDELQSANEEAQSANEELQSINEELETSKEEIQSSNEELTTLNDELQDRNLETARLNSDLSNLIDSLEVAVVMVGRDLRIRRFSPLATRLLNIIPADLGRPLTDIRTVIELPELETLLNAVIDEGGAREREVQDKQGRWFSLRIRRYMTLDNQVDGAVLMLVDVDELRRSRDYAENIVATVREPLLILDQELRVRTANRSFYDTFGATRAEIEGRPFSELGQGQWKSPELRQRLEDVLSGGAPVTEFVLEAEFDGLGLRVMWLNARRLRAPGEARASILLAIEDVTERKRLEAVLSHQNEQLATADAAKNEFLATLAHELRTPLNAVRNWVQIMQLPVTSSDDHKKGLEVIDRNSRAQCELIEDMLDIHRIAAGKVRLEPADVDLGVLLHAVVDTAVPAAGKKAITIEKDFSQAPVTVWGDATRLQQVFGNLITNAIKFTPESGQVRISLRRVGTYAEVAVSDTGQGISAAALPHLFIRYRQAHPSTGRSQSGLGLGLAIVKQLVELHGGSVSAHSPGTNKGATFTVLLPVSSPVGRSRPHVLAREVDPKSRTTLEGNLVIVVEDEPGERESICRILQQAGAEVFSATCGSEALAAIQERQPDVLVSDVGTSPQSRYEMMRAIRALPTERGARIAALALAAEATPSDQDRALKAGFQTVLVTPVDASDLVAAVAGLVAARPSDSCARGDDRDTHVASSATLPG